MVEGRLQTAIVVGVQLSYFLLRAFMSVLQNILHRLNGVREHQTKISTGDETTHVVAVSSVIARLPYLGMSVADYFHFLVWHQRFETLECLHKPNVTLYFVDGENAVFLEHDPNVNIYDTRRYPFFFIAQRMTCTRMLTVPIGSLLRLSQNVQEPKCEVTWICHMARCGSTTVAQGLNAVPNCVVISECQDMLMHLISVAPELNLTASDYVKTDRFKKILKASIKYMLRNFTEEQRVCVKTAASFAYLVMGPAAELFPTHRYISLHRDGAGTGKSFWRMGNGHTLLKAGVWVFNTFPWLFQKRLQRFLTVFTNGLYSEVKSIYSNGQLTLFLFFYVQWVTNIVTFQRNKSAPKQLITLTFDDIQQDKKGSMMKIFSYMGLPMEHIPAALDAMEGDSQAGTPLSWEALQGLKSWVRDEKTVASCNELLSKYKLPSFDQKFRFDANHEIEVYG